MQLPILCIILLFDFDLPSSNKRERDLTICIFIFVGLIGEFCDFLGMGIG